MTFGLVVRLDVGCCLMLGLVVGVSESRNGKEFGSRNLTVIAFPFSLLVNLSPALIFTLVAMSYVRVVYGCL